jgi:hypothetical protein
MKNFIIFATFLALAFSGCKTAMPETQTANRQTDNQGAQETVKIGEGIYKVGFMTNPQTANAGEPTELMFTVKNKKDETIRDLQIVHEKPIHLLVVSEDLNEFYHLHPEAQTDGVYKTSFTFPNGGNFRLYADFTANNSAQIVQDFPLTVSGNQRPPVELKADEKLQKTVNGLRVTMKPDSDLAANKEMRLNFQVTDANTNKPVTDLENYLGAKAHFVIISQDLQEFVHAHPMSTDNVKGAEHSHEMNSMPHEKLQSPNEKLNGVDSESIVSAHVTFPKAGLHKIFAQFQRAGQVITVPFTVNVKEGVEEKPIDLSKAKFPAGAFKIIVSKDGFTPSEISFKQGLPLKLAFYRGDAQNCGSEVIFKDLHITKKLPVGKVVLVDIPTDTAGEFSFACGMNMFKGKIVVQ